MAPSDFPTYGRGDDPKDSDEHGRYARPTPYGAGVYSRPPEQGEAPEGAEVQPGERRPDFARDEPAQPQRYGEPGPYAPPGSYGQAGGYGQPGPYGSATPYGEPGQYGPYGPPPPYAYGGQAPYGTPAPYGGPPPYEGPPYAGQPGPGGPQTSYADPYGQFAYGQLYGGYGPHQQQFSYAEPTFERDRRVGRVILAAAILCALYGLLVLTLQRISLREIAQAPGSPLNHPLRTDVVDAIGQFGVLALGGTALGLWLRDLFARRRAGRPPESVEVLGLVMTGAGLVGLLIWFVMVASTGFGANALDRLPTAYTWGGFGLLLLAGGFGAAYRTLKPPVGNPVVAAAPQRPPWE